MKKHTCPKCKEPKPLDKKYWYRDNSRVSGFSLNMCKVCRNKYQKKYYIPVAQRRSDEGKERAVSVSFDNTCFQEKLRRTSNGITGCDRPIEIGIPLILAQ